MRVRPAGPQDIPALAGMFDAYRQFYGQPPDLALATRFLTERQRAGQSVLLLAESVGSSDATAPAATQALGFCQLYPSFCSVEAAPIYVLYDLFVSPAARRSGAGRALLAAAAERGRADGMCRLDLSTAHDNLAAQALYITMGWRRDEVFRTYSLALGPA